VAIVVSDGRVTLTGEVETEADREMLPLFVSRVPGVLAVSTDLRARTHVA
jgi:osmotically-inducible protein OsmY